MNIYHINSKRQLLNYYLKYLFQRHTLNKNKTIAIWVTVDMLYTEVCTAEWQRMYMCP